MATNDDDGVEEVALGDVRPGVRPPAPPVPPMTPLRLTGTNTTERYTPPGLDQRVRGTPPPVQREAAARRRRASDFVMPPNVPATEPTHHLRGSAGGGTGGAPLLDLRGSARSSATEPLRRFKGDHDGTSSGCGSDNRGGREPVPGSFSFPKPDCLFCSCCRERTEA